jgi:hypothetical protein
MTSCSPGLGPTHPMPSRPMKVSAATRRPEETPAADQGYQQ